MTIVLKAEVHEEQEEEGAVDIAQIGFHFVKPEKYKDLKGSLSMSGGFPDKKLLVVDLEYYAVSPERSSEYSEYCDAYVDAYMNDEELPVPPDPSWMSHYEYAVLFSILAVPDGGGEEELRTLLKQYNYPYYDEFAWLEEVWSDGNTTFYIGQYEYTESSMDKYREYMGDFFEEFEDLYRDKEAFLSAVTLREPIWPGELSIGDVLRFETTDLDGNPVSSEELFAQSKVTMINLWGTWCSPCKRELPELGVMAKEFEAKGCQIIGICDDAYQEGIPETAKALLQDAGCEYLNLTGTPELVQMFHTTSFPTTCFVDSEGTLLLNPIFGAYPDQYREAHEEALFIVELASGEDQSGN